MLELDELWSFVYRRKNKKWVWIAGALWAGCRRTRQVVAFVVGDRSEKTCRLLWQAIPTGYRRATLYSDFWEAYQKVLPDEQHEAVGKQVARPTM